MLELLETKDEKSPGEKTLGKGTFKKYDCPQRILFSSQNLYIFLYIFTLYYSDFVFNISTS